MAAAAAGFLKIEDSTWSMDAIACPFGIERVNIIIYYTIGNRTPQMILSLLLKQIKCSL